MTVAPTSSTAPSNGNPDGPAVLHPVPDRTPPTWLSALLRWAPVGIALIISLWWLEVFSRPGGPQPFVLIPLVLVLLGLAVFAVVRTGGWATRRLQSRSARLPVPALLTGGLISATMVATWLGLPVEVRFEMNRAELDRVVEQLRIDPPATDLPPGQSVTVEAGSYGTLTVTDVPGGWHFATPSPGDRAGVPGFAYFDDPAAADTWPEDLAIRPLGDGWYLADRQA